MAASDPVLVEIVADVICPWCFIGFRRFERALDQRPGMAVDIRWRGYQLHPEIPDQGMPYQTFVRTSVAGMSRERVQQVLVEIGAEEGITFHFDRIRTMPNTVNAHRLVRFAARQGRHRSVIDKLFSAHFVEGRDIGSTATLSAIAAASGLDPDEAALFLEGGTEQAGILADELAARRRGVTGVPCFIIERRYALSGAQEPEFFLPLFDLAREQRAER